MAGKRQHYIPQLLLEGFASQDKGAGSFTWVYRKGVAPFKTNVINVAVEKRFYTEGDDTAADDYITAIEAGPLGGTVRWLRGCSPGPVSNDLLPELVSHLELRTRHLRRSVLAAGEDFISRIVSSVADNGWFLDHLEQELLGDSPTLRAAVADDLKKRGIPLIHLNAVMATAKPMLPALMPGVHAQLAALAQGLQTQLPDLLSKSAKAGHIQMLKRASAQASRVARYLTLHYTLLDWEATQNILGDAVVLFQVNGTRRFKAYLDKQDALEAVFLPLSPTRVLIGSLDGMVEPPIDLNEAIARCSLECFIASDNREANEQLRTLIGRDSRVMADGEMEEIIDELRRGGG